MATTTATMEPEPIPLRTLTVLLNYERVISDPRFKNYRLIRSSISDPSLINRTKASNPSEFAKLPKSIERTSITLFQTYAEPASTKLPPTICQIHPNAFLDAHALTDAQRELLYYQTRGHDGCYKAIGLYQFFFDLYGLENKVSVQIKDEEPLILDLATRMNLEFKIRGPKLHTITAFSGKELSLLNGSKEDECHVVGLFKCNQDKNKWIVVDMSRMQYGEAGRGLFGENYFLGTLTQFCESMKKICGEAIVGALVHPTLVLGGNVENELRLRTCAKRAWERWQNREKEGWCAFCGKPGRDLQKCSACRNKKIFYCCKEHQKSDWKLHKHICERNQK